MDEILNKIILGFRDYLYGKGIGDISLQGLAEKIDIPQQTLLKYFSSKEALVERVLEFERKQFESIFDEYNFEGVNAIDILLTVSKEMALKFKNLSPSVTFDLKKYYPDIYTNHLGLRRDFIYEKIKINLTKGINQGMYRDDLSIELVARLYLARLLDLHNPEYFPPDKFSFETLFNFMFENFVRSIATEEGLAYFVKRKKEVKL